MNAQLTHVGTATLLLEVAGLRLLTDPVFDPAGTRHSLATLLGTLALSPVDGPHLSIDEIEARGAIDAVLLSHDHHPDNFDDRGRELARRARQVVTTPSGAARLKADGFPAVSGLRPWQSIEIPSPAGPPLSVTATPARHGPIGSGPLVGEVVGFVLESPCFSRGAVWISGDTVWFRGTAEVARRFRVGTAILHVGAARFRRTRSIRYTMSAAEVPQAARAFTEAMIVPIHYEGWRHFSEGRSEIERECAKAGVTQQLHWLPQGVTEAIEI